MCYAMQQSGGNLLQERAIKCGQVMDVQSFNGKTKAFRTLFLLWFATLDIDSLDDNMSYNISDT